MSARCPAVRYRLRVPEPHTHLLHVEMTVEGVRGPARLRMPSWTPGSYLMREFPRNVWRLEATDGAGRALPAAKEDKNTWSVPAPADGTLHVRYAVYANELSVRTSHVDASHAAVNGASAFLWCEGRQAEPLSVAVLAPEGWRIDTPLPRMEPEECAEPGEVFRAAHYDELVDSPFEIGTHERIDFEVDGVPHRYAVWGRGNHDAARLRQDTVRIVRAERALFGGLPYASYLIVLHLSPGGYGGLEHRDGTALLMDRWAFRGEEYEKFLGLVAHELFHAWNGKRIRPAVLGPFDYTREGYTRDLWVVEGFTTYYTDLVLRRAGLISRERYLELLGQAISRYRATPGRRVQPLADSSFDTWIRFYRPDASSPNAQVSYYQKGAMVALLLDLRIRAATGGARSLDDVVRLLWERFGARDVGYPEGEAERVAAEVCGEDLTAFFDRALRSTEELDFDSALSAAGLRLEAEGAPTVSPPAPGAPLAEPEGPGAGAAPADASASSGGESGDAKPSAPGDAPGAKKPEAAAPKPETVLGVRLKKEGERTTVTHVLSDTPAWRAGVNAGDELVAWDGLRVSADTLAARAAERAPGDRVALTVFRRDELVALEVEMAAAPPSTWKLVPVDEPTAEQRAVLDDWLREVVPGGEPSVSAGA